VILNAKKNPNFSMMVKHVDIELPEQEMYCPPLTIRVVDCRSDTIEKREGQVDISAHFDWEEGGVTGVAAWMAAPHLQICL
jgi:hypothetical protein